MNLLAEYYKRHKSNAIPVAPNGLVFFNDYNRPAAIGLVSYYPKQLTTCANCAHNNQLILEVFTPSLDDVPTLLFHEHVNADTDILQRLEHYKYGHCTPHFVSTNRDIEVWMWRFFSSHNKLKSNKNWRDFMACRSKTPTIEQAVEQMFECVIKHGNAFANFHRICNNFVTGRSYLFYE